MHFLPMSSTGTAYIVTQSGQDERWRRQIGSPPPSPSHLCQPLNKRSNPSHAFNAFHAAAPPWMTAKKKNVTGYACLPCPYHSTDNTQFVESGTLILFPSHVARLLRSPKKEQPREKEKKKVTP